MNGYQMIKNYKFKTRAIKKLKRLDKDWDFYSHFSDGFIAKIKQKYYVFGRWILDIV